MDFTFQFIVQTVLLPLLFSTLGAWLAWRVFKFPEAPVLAGILLAVLWISGWQMMPLTSMRKIIIGVFVVFLVLLAMRHWRMRKNIAVATLVVCALVSMLWVVWPVLLRQTLDMASLLGLCVFMLTVVLSVRKVRDDATWCLTQCIAATTLSVAAMMSASALIAQSVGALAAGLGGYFILHLWSLVGPDRVAFRGTIALWLALYAVVALVYAKLPGFVLLALAMMSLLALLPFEKIQQRWLRFGSMAVITILPGAVAIYFTWQQSGNSAY